MALFSTRRDQRIRGIFSDEPSSERRPTRSAECLSVDKLAPRTAVRDLAASDVAHASDCRWCQRQRGVAMRLRCPEGRTLLAFALGLGHPFDREAISFHINDDGCERCWAVVDAPWFKRLATTIDYGRVLVLDALVAPALGEMQTAQDSASTMQPQEWRGERDQESGLAWQASFDGADLIVIVDSDRPAAAGTIVEVQPLGDEGQFERKSIQLVRNRDGSVRSRVDFRGIPPADFRNVLLMTKGT